MTDLKSRISGQPPCRRARAAIGRNLDVSEGMAVRPPAQGRQRLHDPDLLLLVFVVLAPFMTELVAINGPLKSMAAY